jgi:hypothetical protein
MKKPNLLPILCALMMTGCGVIKNRGDRTVVATENPAMGRSGQAAGRTEGGPAGDAEDEALRQIRQFLDLYTDHGALNRQGLANFISKYKDKIAPFLDGMHLTPEELIELLFKFDGDQDGKLTPQELADGLSKRIPILRWIPDNQASVARDELLRQISREYPRASATACRGLADALMRLDAPWAEGNGDGRLSRAEASGAGILIMLLSQTDFSHGVQLPPGSLDPGATGGLDLGAIGNRMIAQKMSQQLFARYADPRVEKLLPDDRRLEWIQLALELFVVDKLVHHWAAPESSPLRGCVPDAQAASALSAWGIRQEPHWSTLRKVYEHPVMGGMNDGSVCTLQAFNLLTDLEFARKARVMAQGQFTAKALKASPNHGYLLSGLAGLLPRTGNALFFEDDEPGAPRAYYWDWINRQFDDSFRGGNDDGSLDDGEVAMFIAYAKIEENLFELFDTDHDGYLSRPEGDRAFASFGLTDARIIDAFYANAFLSNPSPSDWQKFKCLISHCEAHARTPLTPYNFHMRMVQVLPRVLEQPL